MYSLQTSLLDCLFRRLYWLRKSSWKEIPWFRAYLITILKLLGRAWENVLERSFERTSAVQYYSDPLLTIIRTRLPSLCKNMSFICKNLFVIEIQYYMIIQEMQKREWNSFWPYPKFPKKIREVQLLVVSKYLKIKANLLFPTRYVQYHIKIYGFYAYFKISLFIL